MKISCLLKVSICNSGSGDGKSFLDGYLEFVQGI